MLGLGVSGKGADGSGRGGEVTVCREGEVVRITAGLNTGNVVGDAEQCSGCWCG